MTKLIYLGPSRPYGLPIRTNAILAGTPEEVFPEAAPVLAAHPELKKLFVPVGQIPQAKAQLALSGSPLAAIFRKVKEAANG